MRRRQFMRAGAGAALTLASVGVGAATTAQDAYAPLGSVQLSNAREAVVSEDGETAYVAEMDAFTTADVSDPSNPEVLTTVTDILADREQGPFGGLQDLSVDGDRLIVAGPPGPKEDALQGFLLYDVTDPANPERLAFYESTVLRDATRQHGVHNCYLDGETAYLTGTDFQTEALVVVDISNDRPERVATWAPPDADEAWADVKARLYNLHDVFVRDDVAYLASWESGAWLLDVADPASPSVIANVGGRSPSELQDVSRFEPYQPPGNAHYVQPSDDGSTLFVGAESWNVGGSETEGGPSGIDVWDITDPTAAERVATIDPPLPADGDTTYQSGTWTTSHNFDVQGGRLYSSWYQGGVKIHDVSDPANPAELAWWRQPDDWSFWTAQLAVDGEFFVASTMRRGTSTPTLHTFPDRAGEMADPPDALVSGSSGRDPNGGTDTPTDTRSPTETTAAGSATADDDESDETTGGSGPGFGIAATGAGVGLAAARYLRGRDDGD